MRRKMTQTRILLKTASQLANQDHLIQWKIRFIAQLAQFSSLEQMQNLNKAVGNLNDELFKIWKL